MGERTSPLSCPRCGYDVSGVVPTWVESCPLDGTCSECGLVFAWVDIFRPDRIAPAWSYEHARSRLRLRWYATVARTLRPSRFWNDLRLAAPLRPRRIAWFLLWVFGFGWLAVAACGACEGYLLAGPAGPTLGGAGFFPQLPDTWNLVLTMALWPGPSPFGWIDSMISGAPVSVVLWAAFSVAPFLVLRQSLTRAKCRSIHLLRGWAYQWPGVILVLVPMLFARALFSGNGWASWTPGSLWWTLLGAGGWLAWYWTSFTRKYLRMPRPGFVAACMLIIAGLSAVLADCWVSPPHSGLLDLIVR